MKVSELIKELERLDKGEDVEVVVAVGSAYKRYPVSYEDIFMLNRYSGQELRICVSLGEEFVVRAKGKVRE